MIDFPTDHDEQRKIASGLQAKSSVGFNNCAGAVDGLLIWTSKPTMKMVDDAGLGCKTHKEKIWIEHAGYLQSLAKIHLHIYWTPS